MKKAAKNIATLTAVAIGVVTGLIRANDLDGYETSCADRSPVEMTVEGMNFRDDLSRLSGTLIGRPHTSCRIDSAFLVAGGRRYRATDIDGVDMGRYFQWEEDGKIAVEIDFAPMPEADTLVIELSTPRGMARATAVRR